MSNHPDSQLLPLPEVRPLSELIEMRPFAWATRSLGTAGTLLALDQQGRRFSEVMASTTVLVNIEGDSGIHVNGHAHLLFEHQAIVVPAGMRLDIEPLPRAKFLLLPTGALDPELPATQPELGPL